MHDKIEKAMIFGVFDGLHDGHIFFIEKAKEMCKNLVVVVTPDIVVSKLKNRLPLNTEDERILKLKTRFPDLNIVMGDQKLNSWKILDLQNPDLIILGYDQKEISDALMSIKSSHDFDIKIIKEDYKGDVLHSSLLG